MIESKSVKEMNIIEMEQVHGDRVILVGKNNKTKINNSITDSSVQTIKKCDGLITDDPNVVLSIRVADCLPIFFYSPTTNSIGLIHAGWRGLYKGIIGKTIEFLRKKLKTESQELFVFIGPHICQKHYEIKTDGAKKFSNYPKAIKKVKGKIYLDLEKIAKEQLISLGVKKNNIKIDRTCTYETKSLDSFRRGDLKKRTKYLFSLPDSS